MKDTLATVLCSEPWLTAGSWLTRTVCNGYYRIPDSVQNLGVIPV
jgi:hypothetical protein